MQRAPCVWYTGALMKCYQRPVSCPICSLNHEFSKDRDVAVLLCQEFHGQSLQYPR